MLAARRACACAVVALVACHTQAPATRPLEPTLVVAVPLAGPDAAAGEQIARGVRLAAGEAFGVLVADDAGADVVKGVVAREEVVGVVGHVGRAAAERNSAAWVASRLAVVLTAPTRARELPTVVAPLREAAECASHLLEEGPYVIRTDGETESVAAATALQAAHPDGFGGTGVVSPGDVPVQAAKLQHAPGRVVWIGESVAGGNLLHAVRALGGTPFVAIDAQTPGFLRTAGSAAAGATVTGTGRPALDPEFRGAYTAVYGDAPSPAAGLGYDAARLLIEAWRVAGGPASTRDGIRSALPGARTTGTAGAMGLSPDGVVVPVTCASYRVDDGGFVPLLTWPVAGEPLEPGAAWRPGAPEASPAPPRRRRKPEGEWLKAPER